MEINQSSKQSTILIVDDDEIFITLIFKKLEKNYNVKTALNGLEAIDVIKNTNVDLILSDVNMPTLGGHNLVKELKKEEKTSDIPVIFISASHKKEQVLKSLEFGAQDYITKPIDFDQLNLKIKTHIKTYKSKKELIISNNSFHMMFETHSSIMLLVDPNTSEIINVNKSAREFYGYSLDEFLKLTILDININNKVKIEEINNLAINNKQNRFELKHRKKSGEIVDVEVNSSIIKTDRGDIFYSIIKDITEEKKLKQKLEEEKLKYKYILENVSEGIHIIDKNYQIFECNNSFTKMLGYTHEEIINLNAYDWDINFKESEILKIFNENQTEELFIETKYKNKNGILIDIEITANNINIGGENYIIASSRDVTQKKIQERERIETIKMKSLKTMIQNIAHHWRQPLNVISISASGMKYLLDSNINFEVEDYKGGMDEILTSCSYLSNTITEFSSFLESKKLKEVCIIEEEILSAKNILEYTLSNNFVELDINIDTNEKYEIYIYKNDLTQCIINIITNSCDAFDKLSQKNNLIKMKSFICDGSYIIEIEDNAGGIEEAIIDKVFEPYFTTKHQAFGVGLGLTFVYSTLKEVLGGDVKIENTKEGTKVSLFIPLSI